MNKTAFLFFLCIASISTSCAEEPLEEDVYSVEQLTTELVPSSKPSPTEFFNDFTAELFASNSKAHQSSAAYNKYLFLVTAKRSWLYMFNLESKQLLCSLKTGPASGNDTMGSDMYHSNQMTFSNDFYEANDPFPLLYISQHAGEDYRCFTEVYRIMPVRKVPSDDYSSMTLQLVQTIYFPPMSQENSMGNVNCVIDRDNNLMYTYSRNNRREADNYSLCKISMFAIPDITQSVVYLEDCDILNSFMLDHSAFNMQGGCIKDGLLYIGQGYSSVKYIYLNVIDLNKREEIGRIDLYAKGIRWEPEGCFVYNDELMISTNDSNIWQIKFN